jgi:hypothetical protein
MLDKQKFGGGGGIRTHETLSGLTVFKTAAFNHSATPPMLTRIAMVAYSESADNVTARVAETSLP